MRLFHVKQIIIDNPCWNAEMLTCWHHWQLWHHWHHKATQNSQRFHNWREGHVLQTSASMSQIWHAGLQINSSNHRMGETRQVSSIGVLAQLAYTKYMHSFFHLFFIHLFIYSLIHSIIHSFVFSFTHLFIHSLSIIINTNTSGCWYKMVKNGGKWCKRNVKQNDWTYGFIVNNWTHINWVSSWRETSPRGLQGRDTEDPTSWVSSRKETSPLGPQGIYETRDRARFDSWTTTQSGNMSRQPCAGLMLSHRLRQRANICSAQGRRPLFPGLSYL